MQPHCHLFSCSSPFPLHWPFNLSTLPSLSGPYIFLGSGSLALGFPQDLDSSLVSEPMSVTAVSSVQMALCLRSLLFLTSLLHLSLSTSVAFCFSSPSSVSRV